MRIEAVVETRNLENGGFVEGASSENMELKTDK